MTDLAIDELLEDLGYSSVEARDAAKQALVDAKLTTPRKERIAASKVPTVRTLLASRFAIVCAREACRLAVPPSLVTFQCARSAQCSGCGGLTNQAAIDRAVGALLARKLSRLIVVGGSPATREELEKVIANRLEMRLVSGTQQRNSTTAKADLAWAQLIVIWGGTELDHKVSKLYTDRRIDTVIVCPRRGIEALAATLLEAANRR